VFVLRKAFLEAGQKKWDMQADHQWSSLNGQIVRSREDKGSDARSAVYFLTRKIHPQAVLGGHVPTNTLRTPKIWAYDFNIFMHREICRSLPTVDGRLLAAGRPQGDSVAPFSSKKSTTDILIRGIGLQALLDDVTIQVIITVTSQVLELVLSRWRRRYARRNARASYLCSSFS